MNRWQRLRQYSQMYSLLRQCSRLVELRIEGQLEQTLWAQATTGAATVTVAAPVQFSVTEPAAPVEPNPPTPVEPSTAMRDALRANTPATGAPKVHVLTTVPLKGTSIGCAYALPPNAIEPNATQLAKAIKRKFMRISQKVQLNDESHDTQQDTVIACRKSESVIIEKPIAIYKL